MLIQWIARLAILAYVFQLGAFDHYFEPGSADAAENSFHAAHCHGGASGCADAVSLSYTLAEAPIVAAPPDPIAYGLPEPIRRLTGYVPASLEVPPRHGADRPAGDGAL